MAKKNSTNHSELICLVKPQNKSKNSIFRKSFFIADFLMILMILSTLNYLGQQTVNAEDTMDFDEYVTYYGYPVQEHIIRTSDGYHLKFFRIQQKNTNIQQLSGKPVVYLQHGNLDSSDTFIINEERLAPAFVFANKGFDVWVGNSRGNRYSSKDLSPGVRDFWNFSFDQMAEYDLPAAFKYIASKTQQKIHYISHSRGSLLMFIALSEKYAGVQENLLSFNAWGPSVYLTNMESKVLSNLAAGSGIFSGLISFKQELLGYLPILDFPKIKRQINAGICQLTPEVCSKLLLQFAQKNNTVNNMERMPVFAGHFPAGSSLKDLLHMQQYSKTPIFRKFDYGNILANSLMYGWGNLTPPKYDLSKVTFPYINLLVGTYDKLATIKDAERIWAQISNVQHKDSAILSYGHLTFIMGKQNTHIDLSIEYMRRSLSGQ